MSHLHAWSRGQAAIMVKRKRYHLGVFGDRESASRAYEQAAIWFFGEFARA